MKMIISPAKSLNFEKELPTSKASQSVFLSESERINKLLKKKSVAGLGNLMGISQKLSQLNWERNQASYGYNYNYGYNYGYGDIES